MNITRGQNNEDVLNLNRALIVQYLQRHGICTRAQLSKVIGLTQASISKTVAGLLENGIIRETGVVPGEKGRRSVGITLCAGSICVIGVKVSRRHLSAGVFDFRGKALEMQSDMLPEDISLPEILERAKGHIREFLARYRDIQAIGVAVPGPYDHHTGRILLMTEMKDWQSVSVRDALEGQFPVPVIIRHDANSGALAEWWFGTQIYMKEGTLIHFLVGEGVGAGVIVNGSVLTGDRGIAGEVGHMSVDVNGPRCACGNYGCLELYCSSLAFVKHAREALRDCRDSELAGIRKLTAQDIFSAAGRGDALAQDLVRRAGRYIGYGIVNLVNAYDPTTILIGNVMAGGGALLLEEAVRVVQDRIPEHMYRNLRIGITGFSDDPVLYGAAAAAIDFYLKEPGLLIQRRPGSQKS